MVLTQSRALPLAFVLGLVVLGLQPAHADLLQQKAVIGFPIDGVIQIAQINSTGTGAHRLAVLHANYLLGLQWSARRNAYDQTFFTQGSFGNGVIKMVIADGDGDGRNDIVVFANDYSGHSVVNAYRAPTGAPLTNMHRPEIGTAPLAQHSDGATGDEI